MAITEILSGSSGKRDIAYAVCGVLLGVLAPLGWIILRLVANDDRAEDEVTGPQLRDAVARRVQVVLFRHLGDIVYQHHLTVGN